MIRKQLFIEISWLAQFLDQMQIRLATRGDLESIYLIEDQSFSDPYPHNLLTKLFHAYKDTFFVAQVQPQIVVGYCVAAQEGKSAHVISLGVLREYRRRGIGTALVQALLTNLSPRLNEVRLEVKQGNGDAIRLYERLGFELMDLVEGYYTDGSAAVKMRLPLANGLKENAESSGRRAA